MFPGYFPTHNPMQSGGLEKQFQDEEMPLSIEPILAWRCWTVEMNERRGVFLDSITHRMRWPRKKPARAHCLGQLGRKLASAQAPHSAPDRTHQCGIYAVKEPEAAKKWL